ncbi:hypothetical protein [Promicromonospora sp. NPDC050880]|uniref:hypothetical protein n=1 Tax=unclassified Promicromonospora TaxID=2647929 RepID=UPI003799DA70
MKKLLAGGTLAVLAFGGMLAGAAPASAHIPEATSGCNAESNFSWVNAKAKMYPADATVNVVIDGAEVEAGTFADLGFKSGQQESQYEYSYEKTFDALDPTVAHTWTVSFDSPDGQGVKDYEGAIEPCVEAAPTPEPTPSEPAPEPSEEPSEPVVEPTPEPSEAPSEEAVPPAPAEPSASPSPAAEEPPVLAATGATVGGAVAFAALLAVGGVALVWARKRMQQGA